MYTWCGCSVGVAKKGPSSWGHRFAPIDVWEVSILSGHGGLMLQSTLSLRVDDGILCWNVMFAMVSGVDELMSLGTLVT